jgi:hypothetical protein
MGQNDLGGVLEDFSVHPLSDEQARQASLVLAEAAVRRSKRHKHRADDSRARYNLETALLAAGLKDEPSEAYARAELGAALQRLNRKEKRC